MNTLSDTLKDLTFAVLDTTYITGDMNLGCDDEKRKQIIEEYVERIKNELNVDKYLQ